MEIECKIWKANKNQLAVMFMLITYTMYSFKFNKTMKKKRAKQTSNNVNTQGIYFLYCITKSISNI